MDDIILPLLIAALAVYHWMEILPNLFDTRRPTRLRVTGGLGAFFLGLLYLGFALWSYPPTYEFLLSILTPGLLIFLGLNLVVLSGALKLIASEQLRRWQLQTTGQASLPASPDQLAESVIITDVTHDPTEAARANRPAGLIHSLTAHGFRSLGLLKTSTPPTDATQVSEVTEIFAAPDRRAFAEPEVFFACEAVTLRTRLPNGAILDTTLLVDRPGATRFQHWQTLFRWPRIHHPGAGYHFQRLHNATVEDLLARHTARLDCILQRTGVQLPPHTTLANYADISRAAFRIEAHARLLDLLVLAITLPALIAFPAVWLLSPNQPVWMFVLIPLAIILLAFVLVRLARHLPFRAMRGVSALFDLFNRLFS